MVMKKIKLALSKEIGLALLFKVLFILGLWWCCFSHPLQKSITPAVMQQHLMN